METSRKILHQFNELISLDFRDEAFVSALIDQGTYDFLFHNYHCSSCDMHACEEVNDGDSEAS